MPFELTPLQVSVTAAIISLISLAFAALTYRRASARVKVQVVGMEVELRKVNPDQSLQAVLKFTARVKNSGLAECDIRALTMWLFSIPRRIRSGEIVRGPSLRASDGEDFRILPNQTKEWDLRVVYPATELMASMLHFPPPGKGWIYSYVYSFTMFFVRIFSVLWLIVSLQGARKGFTQIAAFVVELGGGRWVNAGTFSLLAQMTKVGLSIERQLNSDVKS